MTYEEALNPIGKQEIDESVVIMTNTELLEEEIKNSGLKIIYLAQKLNLSRVVLTKKINGETEFKASEIVTLCTELKITSPKQRTRIFFRQEREHNS